MDNQNLKILEEIFHREIINIEEAPLDHLDSITGNVSLQTPSIFKYNITFVEQDTIEVIVKYKSQKVIEHGASLINYEQDPRLFELILPDHKLIGFDDSYIREILFYHHVDESLKKHLLKIYGTYHNNETDTYLLALEEGKSTRRLDASLIIKTLDSITDFHAKYYNDHTCVEKLGLNEYLPDDYTNYQETITYMLDKLEAENHLLFSEENLAIIYDFVSHAGKIYQTLLDHRSLTHNDFTPRNIFYQDDSILIYDWELACYQNPEHDLIEFLLMIMSELDDQQVQEIIGLYRMMLESKTQDHLEDTKYYSIIYFNILEYCINRLLIFRMANHILQLDFINTIARNANRLIDLFKR